MGVRSYILWRLPFLKRTSWTSQQHPIFISHTQLLWIGLHSSSEHHLFCVFCTHLAFCLTLGYPFNFDMPVSISEESETENRSQLPSYSLCPHQRTDRRGKGKSSSLQYVLARKDLTEPTGKWFIEWNNRIYSAHFVRRSFFLVYQCLFFNSLNAELNPICHLLALLGAHRILHVSSIRVKGFYGVRYHWKQRPVIFTSVRACEEGHHWTNRKMV